MISTVMWRKQAIEELALVWMATADRQRLSDAVSRIDAAFRVNPEVKGVDFFGDRLLVVAPLAAVMLVEAIRVIAEPQGPRGSARGGVGIASIQ